MLNSWGLLLLLPALALPAEEPRKPAGYAGSETCQACHEDLYKGLAKNAHGLLDKETRTRGSKSMAWTGEACHGPGARHAESVDPKDIFNPAKQSVAKASEACLSCHRNQPTQVGRIQGVHAHNQVSCIVCHTMHKEPQALVARKNAAINEQCAACHIDVWAQFQRPHKHKLVEKAMSCVDCHNPHGGFLPKQIQTVAANEPGCLKCHGDKRGPFVFEHAPVKLEGCSTCHEPHGSANPRMLTRHEVRFQCLECHSNTPIQTAVSGGLGGIPPGLHDLRSARFRNCTICHMKVHGSQVSRELLR
jgi:DmsE family decaheme c-type cytochrome